MIFQVTDGKKYLVGEVNRVNSFASGNQDIKPILGSNGKFVFNGSNIAWNEQVNFLTDAPYDPITGKNPRSISEKFQSQDNEFDRYVDLVFRVDELEENFRDNEELLSGLIDALISKSNFLDFEEDGIISKLSFTYDKTTGELNLLGGFPGNVEPNNTLVAGTNLILESEIAYAGVHKYLGEGVWEIPLPVEYFGEDGNKIKGTINGTDSNNFHIVLVYKQSTGAYTYTLASLKNLTDIYTAGNGLDLENGKFRVIGGAGINVKEDSVNVLVDNDTGLFIDEINNKVQYLVTENNLLFDNIPAMVNAAVNKPNGTMLFVYDEADAI